MRQRAGRRTRAALDATLSEDFRTWLSIASSMIELCHGCGAWSATAGLLELSVEIGRRCSSTENDVATLSSKVARAAQNIEFVEFEPMGMTISGMIAPLPWEV